MCILHWECGKMRFVGLHPQTLPRSICQSHANLGAPKHDGSVSESFSPPLPIPSPSFLSLSLTQRQGRQPTIDERRATAGFVPMPSTRQESRTATKNKRRTNKPERSPKTDRPRVRTSTSRQLVSFGVLDVGHVPSESQSVVLRGPSLGRSGRRNEHVRRDKATCRATRVDSVSRQPAAEGKTAKPLNRVNL